MAANFQFSKVAGNVADQLLQSGVDFGGDCSLGSTCLLAAYAGLVSLVLGPGEPDLPVRDHPGRD